MPKPTRKRIRRPGRTRRPLLALIALLLIVLVGYVVQASTGGPSRTSTTTVAESALPSQAQHTIALIQTGGPFPDPEDGEVFRNDQHLLPAEPRGYYHEYTVATPGESTRGPRRLITGGGGQFYYTADHYRSFRRVLVGK